jgi:hypothetical protein
MSLNGNGSTLTPPQNDGILEKKDSLFKDKSDTVDDLTEEKLELSILAKKYAYLFEPVKVVKENGVPDFVNLNVTELSLPKHLQNRKMYRHFDFDETEAYYKYSYNYIASGSLTRVDYPNSFQSVSEIKKETKTEETAFDPTSYTVFQYH